VYYVNFKVFPHIVRMIRQCVPLSGLATASLIRGSLLSALTLFMIPAAAQAHDIDWSNLNLSQQQESQINHLEEGWEKTHDAVGGQIQRDMEELRTLLPTGDTQRIRQLQNRIMTNKMYLMNESMNTFLKKRDMLTPTQRAQLQQMLPTRVRNTVMPASNNNSEQ
jgi:Spy/CpxP family protein refolding chaperone